jgi:hypothetical protein
VKSTVLNAVRKRRVTALAKETRAISPENNIPVANADIRPLENGAALRPDDSNVISDRDLPEICFRAGTRSP